MKTLFFTMMLTLLTGLSIHAQQQVSDFNVYPNPAHEVLYLHDSAGINSFMVLDQMGKTVRFETVTSAGITVKLDVSNLPQGTYFVLVNAGTTRQTTKRFLKV